MTKRSMFAKGVVALAAGAMALSAAATAAAQPYGQYGYNGNGAGYGYDPCKRESSGRSVVGALLGGAIGASVGANAAARNARQDGALLGGAVGALAGAAIGKNGAACTGGQPQYARAPQAYYNPQPQPYAYAQPGFGYEQDVYQPRGGRRHRDRAYGGVYADNSYAYGRGGERYRMTQREVGADGCTLAESPIHMPDGRVQTRFVRVCMDSSGRYQVVD
ncbi:hypothetical protein [Phenylobacterium sp.]|uniref:hypothetical protein n=1 Tax=Phenylobacterium sp. TaxID=1871053 RepID=UPI002F95F1EC